MEPCARTRRDGYVTDGCVAVRITDDRLDRPGAPKPSLPGPSTRRSSARSVPKGCALEPLARRPLDAIIPPRRRERQASRLHVRFPGWRRRPEIETHHVAPVAGEAGPRFLGHFRCAEPRLPSSSAAMVGDNGALGLGMNILHLPRLLPAQTWRGSFGPDGGGPTLARERQPCPHRANQIRRFLRATSEHLKGPTFESAATSSHSCPLAE